MATSIPDHDHVTIADRRVRIFPSTDPAFRAAVLAAFGVLGDGDGVGDRLEDVLRREFHGVRVVEQTELGAAFGAPCLYVFRDGSIMPQLGDGPGTPRYIGPLVVPQRTVARNILARHRAATLVAWSERVVLSSREARARRQAAELLG